MVVVGSKLPSATFTPNLDVLKLMVIFSVDVFIFLLLLPKMRGRDLKQ